MVRLVEPGCWGKLADYRVRVRLGWCSKVVSLFVAVSSSEDRASPPFCYCYRNLSGDTVDFFCFDGLNLFDLVKGDANLYSGYCTNVVAV